MSTKQAPGAAHQPADGLFEQLHEIMFLFRAKLMEEARTDVKGAAGMEYRVLRFFDHHPGATQADLVRHSGRDKGQIARLVAMLIERGLLKRDAALKRSGVLRLTERGQTLQQQSQRHRNALAAKYAAALTAAERSQLMSLLQRIRSALTEP